MNKEPEQIAQPSTWMSMNEAEKAKMYGPFLPTLDIFYIRYPPTTGFASSIPVTCQKVNGNKS